MFTSMTSVNCVCNNLLKKSQYKRGVSVRKVLPTFSKKVFFVLPILVLLATNTTIADRRSYVWTYEYMTMPKGKSEVEYYLTHKATDYHKYDNKNSWEHQVEYEYGLTDKWDLSIYQRWKQSNTSKEDKFEYTGTKLRTRYRIGEKGMYPFDTLLYLEYIRPDNPEGARILEGKLVLAKDFGKFNFAYNQILKVGINDKGGNENEYACGMNYEFHSRLKVGLESTGNYTEDKYYIGPTVSWANENFWVGLGVQRGLNDRSDDYKFRLIIGFPF